MLAKWLIFTKEIMDRKLLIMLCLCPLDKAQGFELLKLWADLEDEFNPRISVAICLRFDMKLSEIPQSLILHAKRKFNLYLCKSKRAGVGWPAGCNALEIGAYEWFVEKNRFNERKKEFDFEYVLLAEADTVPLRKGWADEIMNEAYDNKAIILGAYFTKEDGCAHINGNCVIHRDAWKTIKSIWHVPSRRGWDCFIGPQALTCGVPSRLIWQDYRLGMPDNPWKGDDFLFAEKQFTNSTNPLYGEKLKPCFLHGIKTMAGINAVRKKFLTFSQI